MKIAIFTDTYLPTINGISYATKNWKEELERRGHEVDIVCPEAKECPSNKTFKSFEIPFYKNYYAGYYPPGEDFSDYDIIHLNSFFTVGFYGYLVAKRNDIRLVSVVHTPIEEYTEYVTSIKPIQNILGSAYKRFESFILKRSDVRIGLSDYMEERIESITGKDDIKRLNNGVNTKFFKPVEDKAFRGKHGIESEKIVGYLGRLSSEKRVDELIRFGEKYEMNVLIGGDGPHKDKLESMSSSDKTRFLGFVERDEIPSFYSVIDLMIFPSTVENDPLTVLEANACGTPVIGAEAAGLKDSIKEGINGYLYDPENLEDLKEKVEEAFDELPKLSKSSIEEAESNSISKTVDDLLGYYKSR